MSGRDVHSVDVFDDRIEDGITLSTSTRISAKSLKTEEVCFEAIQRSKFLSA